MMWIMENENDPNLDDPIVEEVPKPANQGVFISEENVQ
jgi:uncharacterized UBP type Zn finger protein